MATGLNLKKAQLAYDNVKVDIDNLENQLSTFRKTVAEMNATIWYGGESANRWYESANKAYKADCKFLDKLYNIQEKLAKKIEKTIAATGSSGKVSNSGSASRSGGGASVSGSSAGSGASVSGASASDDQSGAAGGAQRRGNQAATEKPGQNEEDKTDIEKIELTEEEKAELRRTAIKSQHGSEMIAATSGKGLQEVKKTENDGKTASYWEENPYSPETQKAKMPDYTAAVNKNLEQEGIGSFKTLLHGDKTGTVNKKV